MGVSKIKNDITRDVFVVVVVVFLFFVFGGGGCFVLDIL